MNRVSFTIREADLAAKLGVPRDTLKDFRDKGHLNGEWQRQPKGPARCILYTEAGAAKVAKLCGLNGHTIAVEWQQPENGLEELTVVRANFINRRVLHAMNKEKAVVTVRVRSADNFVPRMVIKAKPVNERVYEYYGRYPRSKGRM